MSIKADSHGDELAQLRNEYDEYKTTSEEIQRELEAQLDEADKNCNVMASQIEELKAANKKYKASSDESEGRLMKELDRYKQQVQDQELTLRTLSKAKVELENDNDALIQQNRELQSIVSELEEKIESQLEELAMIQTELEDTKANSAEQIERLKQHNLETQQELFAVTANAKRKEEEQHFKEQLQQSQQEQTVGQQQAINIHDDIDDHHDKEEENDQVGALTDGNLNRNIKQDIEKMNIQEQVSQNKDTLLLSEVNDACTVESTLNEGKQTDHQQAEEPDRLSINRKAENKDHKNISVDSVATQAIVTDTPPISVDINQQQQIIPDDSNFIPQPSFKDAVHTNTNSIQLLGAIVNDNKKQVQQQQQETKLQNCKLEVQQLLDSRQDFKNSLTVVSAIIRQLDISMADIQNRRKTLGNNSRVNHQNSKSDNSVSASTAVKKQKQQIPLPTNS